MGEPLTLPHFLGIGAVKAGTTWLHDALRAHPDLYLPLHKPVFYWDRHIDKPLSRYAHLFEAAGGRLCGELTASYSVLPEATIARIRELVPRMKVLFVMREPRARAWSEAKMEFSVVNPKPDPTEDDYVSFLNSRQCADRGDYAAIIRRWRSAFGADQVYIGLYDDLQEDPRGFLSRILDFLGATTDVDWSRFPLGETIFKGIEKALPDRCAEILDRMYTREAIDRMSEASGLDLARRWGYSA